MAWLVALDETITALVALFAGTAQDAAVTHVAEDSALDVLRDERVVVVDVQFDTLAFPRLLSQSDLDWHQIVSQDIILQRF